MHTLLEIRRHVIHYLGSRSEGDANRRSPGDVTSKETFKVVRLTETLATRRLTTVIIATPFNTIQFNRDENVDVRWHVIVSQTGVSNKPIPSAASIPLPPVIVAHIQQNVCLTKVKY